MDGGGGKDMTTRVIVLSLLAAGLAVTLSGPGQAYDAMPTPEDMGLNYTIAVGAAIPITNVNLPNSEFPDIELAWYGAAEENNFGSMAAFGLSADWIGIKRNDVNGNNRNVNLIPLLFNYKQSAIISSYRVFVNLGVGMWFSSADIPELRRNSGSSFAWTAGVGLDITNRIYGNFRFLAGQNPGDDGLASIQLGYRF
jgi:hypothetical protein